MQGYAEGELARALRTAGSHEDSATRARADARATAWSEVLQGMSSGRLQIGSRTPGRGLPAWVTPQVVRGGFATGRAVAGGPLQDYERQWADQAGVGHSRALLFGYFLTDPGLAVLDQLLTARTYEAAIPEEVGLLTVAWLLRAGDRPAALELLEGLAPFADRLRFTPRPSMAAGLPPDYLFLRSASQVKTRLESKPASPPVEAQRETLAVWNPLADRFLALWWSTRDDRNDRDAVGSSFPDDWAEAASSLLQEYDDLKRIHTRSGKHRNPKQNLWVLVAATRAQLEGRRDAQLAGRLRVAVADMVVKRGIPGSESLQQLRSAQAEVAATPAHRDLARVAASRLAAARGDEGLLDASAYGYPVTEDESQASGVRSGVPMPRSVTASIRRAQAAPLQDLVAAGAVSSAEVLASLVPSVTAGTVSDTYPDSDLGALMAAGYLAFRRRRSLLLLDLQQQVQFNELPWVDAVAAHGQPRRPDDTLQVVRQIGGMALDAFPGTIMPNTLVRELNQLLTSAGLRAQLTEEVAADIFMGRFSDKFLRAARDAARLLTGTLYADYYDLDLAQLEHLQPDRRLFLWFWPRRRPQADTFTELCVRRAHSTGRSWSAANNGTIIEQAQILTTHNLAALVHLGVQPTRPWPELALAAYQQAEQLIVLSQRQRRPLPSIKDAAYAWRQTLFFLSMAEPTAVAPFLEQARTTLPGRGPARPSLDALLAGLDDISHGQRFDLAGVSTHGRRLTGWATSQHWLTQDRGTALTDPTS